VLAAATRRAAASIMLPCKEVCCALHRIQEHSMARLTASTLAACLLLGTPLAFAQQEPHQRQAREVFERVISFRTAQGHKQVPPMARYIEETLIKGGAAKDDIVTLPHEDTLAMLVRVPGSDPAARPILFSAHMDVVDARPEDWERSPFTLIEENGMFFGRGTIDNKTGVTSMVSTILRLHAAKRRPRRTLVFAFIGDEEVAMQTTRLVAAHEWVRNAEFAINTDAGGGSLSPDGRPQFYLVQGAEKTYADFKLTVTNPGGHSSWPRTDNAIYDLARALARIEQHRFPVMANELTRSYFATMGKAIGGETGKVLERFAANPKDEQASDALWKMPEFVGGTRTTCVATMLDAGHAPNALPQKATANVNCRIFPGHAAEDVRQTLVKVIGDDKVQVESPANVNVSPASEPRDDVMAAVRTSIHATFPGLPITPFMESGGTDGLVYRSAGIPTFATSGIFLKASDMFAHGLNERVPVASFYQAIAHIHELAVSLGDAR
jgi:acetylornithine deacetylase/succinyl-diaminopimelate desuccinylase-like protein